MLSTEKCRQLIPDSENLSEEDLSSIRESLYDLAQLAFESWKKSDSKNPERVLMNNPEEVL